MWKFKCVVSQTQGRSRGGGGTESVRPSLGFSGPRGSKAREGENSGGSNRNPHRSHEICAEIDKKHVRAVNGAVSEGPP